VVRYAKERGGKEIEALKVRFGRKATLGPTAGTCGIADVQGRRGAPRVGAIAEFEKTALVAKLAAARRRKRIATGQKVEGRKSLAETNPDAVALAKRLARKRPKGAKFASNLLL
jgi:hypothetical protein